MTALGPRRGNCPQPFRCLVENWISQKLTVGSHINPSQRIVSFVLPVDLDALEEEILKEFDEKSEPVDIPDSWKEPKFNPEDNPNGRLFSKSTFGTLFPKYREKYLREVWPAVEKILREHVTYNYYYAHFSSS